MLSEPASVGFPSLRSSCWPQCAHIRARQDQGSVLLRLTRPIVSVSSSEGCTEPAPTTQPSRPRKSTPGRTPARLPRPVGRTKGRISKCSGEMVHPLSLIRYRVNARRTMNDNDKARSFALFRRAKTSGFDPPLTSVRTANPSQPFPAFFDPPVERATRGPRC
jgi:hypothetical protein